MMYSTLTRAEQQNDKGDKNEVTNPSPHPSLQVKRSRGRPRKCRCLGSLGSTPDPEKLRKPSKKQSNGKKIPCAICKNNVPFGEYSVKCNICFFWVHLHCSKLQSVKEWDHDYSCSKCNNTTENIRDTPQQTLPSKGSRFRIPREIEEASCNKQQFIY